MASSLICAEEGALVVGCTKPLKTPVGQAFPLSRTDATGLPRWIEPVICQSPCRSFFQIPQQLLAANPFLLQYLFPESHVFFTDRSLYQPSADSNMILFQLSPFKVPMHRREPAPGTPVKGTALVFVWVFCCLFSQPRLSTKSFSILGMKKAGKHKEPGCA